MSVRADLRLGLRLLLRNPGLAGVAIVTLALAIWANTVMFAVVHAILLKPLPFAQAPRLALVSEALPALDFAMGTFSSADYQLYRARQRSFEALGVFQNRDVELSGGERAEHVTGARVTASTFETLGVAPLLGRLFTEAEDTSGQTLVVLSHALWASRYGGDAAIVGRSVPIDRVPHTVIGVMPPAFKFPLPGPPVNSEPAALWVPASFAPNELVVTGGPYNFGVVGRLRDDATLETATAEAATLAPGIQQQYPATFAAYAPGATLELRVRSYTAEVVGNARLLLGVLSAGVGLVLLIACANLGALLLSRGIRRRREMATRAALGASRATLARQLIAEHLVLAAAGGALGWLLAQPGHQWLVALLPPDLPVPNAITMDRTVTIFTIVITLIACLLFGLAPALFLRRTDLLDALRESGRGATAARGGRRLQSLLVVAELAVAIVLLVGAGLLVRSFDKLTAVDPGFRAHQLLALSVPLPARVYRTGPEIRAFYQRTLDRIRTLPGVEHAGLASDAPLRSKDIGAFILDGRAAGANMTPPAVHYTWTLGDYPRSLGVPLVRGRWLTDADRAGTDPVVLINAAMARQFWPGEEAIGKRIRWIAGGGWMTIAGIIGDVRDDGLKAAPGPHVYKPFLQETDALIGHPVNGGLRDMKVIVRASTDPASLAGQITQEIRRIDPALAVADVRTLDRDVQTSVARERFSAVLVAVFAALAALLAMVGVYSVIAFAVAQQTPDLGLRMALGAGKGDVLRLILRTSLRLGLCGAALGLAGAWAVSHAMRGLLFGVTATDPTTFIAAPATLLLVTLLGAGLPAWRATRVEPMQALRND